MSKKIPFCLKNIFLEFEEAIDQLYDIKKLIFTLLYFFVMLLFFRLPSWVSILLLILSILHQECLTQGTGHLEILSHPFLLWLYSTILYSTVLYSIVHHSTVLYSTLLFCSVLYSTLLFSTTLLFIENMYRASWKFRIVIFIYSSWIIQHILSKNSMSNFWQCICHNK